MWVLSQPPEIQYLRPGVNGFLVNEDDIQELWRKVLELLGDDQLRQSFSTNARQTLFKEAPIDGMFQGFLNCAEFAYSRSNSTC